MFFFLSVEKENIKKKKKNAGERRERTGRRHKVLASGKSIGNDGGQIDSGTK